MSQLRAEIIPTYVVGQRRFTNRSRAMAALHGMVTVRPFIRWLDRFEIDNGRPAQNAEVKAKSKSLDERIQRRITKFPGE